MAGRTTRDPAPQGEEWSAVADVLEHVLSEAELRRVCADALLTLSAFEGGLAAFAERVGDEIAATVRGSLGDTVEEPPAPGPGKLKEDWERLWTEWWECVADSADEHGRYVVQEERWDHPYLDATDLTMDLERIAGDLQKILPRAIEAGIPGDDTPSDLLCDTATTLGEGVPEWIEPPDGWWLGIEASTLLFEWQRQVTVGEGGDAFALLDTLCFAQDLAKGLGTDRSPITEFVDELDETQQRRLLDAILAAAKDGGHWQAALGVTHSFWFRLHLELAETHRPEVHAAACAEGIEKDWRLALPVLDVLVPGDGALSTAAAERALAIVERALTGVPGYHREEWDPTTRLFPGNGRLQLESDRAHTLQLFDRWSTVASTLGDDATAAALEIQTPIFRNWEDVPTVLAAIRRVATTRPRIANALFGDWVSHASRVLDTVRTCDQRGWYGSAPDSPGWLPDVFTAALRDDQGAARLVAGVRSWLKQICATPDSFREGRKRLEHLTLHVVPRDVLAERVPRLAEALWGAGPDERIPVFRDWLRAYLGRFAESGLLDDVLAAWTAGAASLPPDPARQSGGSYAACADWLMVVRELDEGTFREVLRDWRHRCRRRRNLWDALGVYGLARS